MKTLVRSAAVCESMSPSSSEVFEFDEVVSSAKNVLGYDAYPLIKAELVERQKAITSNEIRAELAKMDDPPFVPESVERYKEKFHRSSKLMGEWISDHVLYPIFFVAFVLLDCGVIVNVGLSLAKSTTLAGLWVFNMITTGIVVIICFVGIRLTQKRGKNPDTFIDVRTKTEWKLIPIADCEEPIPAFALQTAIDLKKQFGDKVTFFIEKAEVTREERVIERLDPFLVVSLPDESQYYLEVWNEPGFRGKRMV